MDLDDIFTRTVREIYPDFTFRQFLVFREICQEREQKTIRGISAKFNFTGASVCRAVDRLQQMGLLILVTRPMLSHMLRHPLRHPLTKRWIWQTGLGPGLRRLRANAAQEDHHGEHGVMRTRPALAGAAALALLLAGCASDVPAPTIATPAAPEPPPPGWQAIPALNTSGDIVSGYVQSRGLVATGPTRRAWILLNLRESIPIPETGGRAQSVRFLGEYRCAERQWRPLEGAWFARRNAQEPVHAERPRGRGFRAAEAGTLGGSFLDAACGIQDSS